MTTEAEEKPFLYAVEHSSANSYVFDSMRCGLYTRPAPAMRRAKELFKKAVADKVPVVTSVVPLYKERTPEGGTTGRLVPKANDTLAFTQKWPVEKPTIIRAPRG